MDFEEVVKYCATLDKPVVFVEDIAQKKAEIIAQYENVSLGLPHLCMPRASNVAMAAKARFCELLTLPGAHHIPKPL